MPAPAWEDLDVFLQEDDFAVSGIIHLQSGENRPVRGIFDDPYLAARLGGFDRDDNHVTFTVKESDTVGVRRLDTVDVNGKTFDVMSTPQGDGTGMSIIVLANLP